MLPEDWQEMLQSELDKPYMQKLKDFLATEKSQGHIYYPRNKDIFRAFWLTPWEKVKVVIIGQDPYHGDGQATGLAFSVPQGMAIPPSLQNIWKEIKAEMGGDVPRDKDGKPCGDLTFWAEQGVLLLNTTLTVRAGQAGSHHGQGWENFTDYVIRKLSREKEGLIFLLWGAHAISKERLINTAKHYVLKSPHPSPLSAHRGFLGNGHFQKANEQLKAQGRTPIDWL